MSKTSGALSKLGTLLESLAYVLIDLIKSNPDDSAFRAEAEAKIAELLAADEANAQALEVSNEALQNLIDTALAAISPSVEVSPPTLDGELG
jgi:hypothetical protein